VASTACRGKRLDHVSEALSTFTDERKALV
jgi:hypothetical protein